MTTCKLQGSQSPSLSQFEEDDKEDDEDDPFEKIDIFVKRDPLGGMSVKGRLRCLEDYLSKSTEKASKLARFYCDK